ncbi:hypothetical protein NDU88_005325 [Pleurodeles waltl]|uniref:Uncharacterized protein n=1 Tax=Pleurodeles waltl TaxID=8319 RepID=A0AAV7QEM0_PLEWA|nr:hypothetical protein NDU88_005325 [Pleurodeles waltl]
MKRPSKEGIVLRGPPQDATPLLRALKKKEALCAGTAASRPTAAEYPRYKLRANQGSAGMQEWGESGQAPIIATCVLVSARSRGGVLQTGASQVR